MCLFLNGGGEKGFAFKGIISLWVRKLLGQDTWRFILVFVSLQYVCIGISRLDNKAEHR